MLIGVVPLRLKKCLANPLLHFRPLFLPEDAARCSLPTRLGFPNE